MTTLYRVRAIESDTGIERVDMATECPQAARDRAQLWAAKYYGDQGATWYKPSGKRYIAGRLYDDGFREPGTCMLWVEDVKEPDFPETPEEPSVASRRR